MTTKLLEEPKERKPVVDRTYDNLCQMLTRYSASAAGQEDKHKLSSYEYFSLYRKGIQSGIGIY